MFRSTSKQITKLTDKAKAALEGSGKKRKNDASSMTSTSEPKKAKPNQISRNSKDRDTEPLSPSPSAEDIPTKPTQSHKSVVRTEEEEAAIEISDTDQSSNNGVNNTNNNNEDEPSDTDKEESPEDELSELNQFENNLGVNDIREVNERLDLTGACFFNPKPCIVTIEGRRAHEFKCLGKGCKATIRRYLDKKDARSTGNMWKHVRACWGKDALVAADNAKDATEARTKIVRGFLRNGSITASFEWKGKGQVTYSHCQHTRAEMRYSGLGGPWSLV
jgi:hypothetical protein